MSSGRTDGTAPIRAPARGLPAWLGVLPLLPATTDPRLALATGAATLALLVAARPALALLAAPRAPGTRWAATLVILATLAAGLARLVEATWPALPATPGGLAPMLMAVGLLAHAVAPGTTGGDADAAASARPGRLDGQGLADGTRLLVALIAIAGARAALGPPGEHAGTGLAGVALLAALAIVPRPRMARPRHGAPQPPPPPPPTHLPPGPSP